MLRVRVSSWRVQSWRGARIGSGGYQAFSRTLRAHLQRRAAPVESHRHDTRCDINQATQRETGP